MTLRDKLKFWILLPNYIQIVTKGSSPLSLPDAYTEAGEDSLKYVKAYGGTEARNVPEGYTELEYIAGTCNVQYINTGIVPTTDMKIYLKCGVGEVVSGASYSPFGSRQTSGASDGIGIFIGSGSNTRIDSFYFIASASDRWQVDNVAAVGDIYETTFYKGTQTLTKNGTSLGSHSYTPVNTTTQPMYVNALNNAGVLQSGQWGSKIYRFTVEGICDLVPAKRLFDNAIGMWDKIRKQFFTNAGTGTFTAGAEVTAPSPALPRDIWCNNGAIKAIRPLEYLESTGTQYIDTGFVPDINSGMIIDVYSNRADKPRFAKVSATNVAFGCGADSTNVNRDFLIYNGDTQDNTKYWPAENVYGDGTGRYTITIDKQNFSIKASNGTTYTKTVSNDPYTLIHTLIMFGTKDGSGTVYPSICKIYSCKIYDNGTLVRDFIPALDSQNVPCMYDKVEGKCYYNAGTGQFIAPYVPAEYERVEYIEGTDNVQYIDTGIVPNSNMNIYWKFRFMGGGTNVYTSGGRETNATNGLNMFVRKYDSDVNLDFFQSNGRWTISNTISDGDLFEYRIVNKTAEILKNGTSLSTHTFTTDGSTTHNVYLNALNNGGTLSGASGIGRVYRFTIDGVADMIPVRRISDGVLGMYDTIRRQFFTNAGTGSFTCDSSYTELEYIQSSGTQYIDTGVVATNGFKSSIKFSLTSLTGTNTGIIGSHNASSPYGRNCLYIANTANTFRIGAAGTYSIENLSVVLNNIYDITFSTKKDDIYADGYTVTPLSTETPDTRSANTLYLGQIHEYLSFGALDGKIYGCKIWNNDTLVRDFVPAKRSGDNAIGLYDKVEKKFYTNAGTGVFTAGSEIPTPIEPLPIEIMTDGTIEKIGIHSADNKNLFNGAFEQGGFSNGNLVETNVRIRTPGYLTFPAGTYTVSCGSAYEIWVEVNNAGGNPWGSTKTITVTGSSKVKIGVRSKTNPATTVITPSDPVQVQVEAGSTATAYSPYYDGGLATAENLFGIGTTQDVQELLAGDVIRKFGIFFLTGDEPWEKLNLAGKNVYRTLVATPTDHYSNPENNIGVCSHFTVIPTSAGVTSAMNNLELAWNTNNLMCIRYDAITTLANFKAWLVSQYNAGTPVIVLYALETPTTESVAGQTLNVVEGDNYAEIAEASIDGLEIEAKYIKEM